MHILWGPCGLGLVLSNNLCYMLQSMTFIHFIKCSGSLWNDWFESVRCEIKSIKCYYLVSLYKTIVSLGLEQCEQQTFCENIMIVIKIITRKSWKIFWKLYKLQRFIWIMQVGNFHTIFITFRTILENVINTVHSFFIAYHH